MIRNQELPYILRVAQVVFVKQKADFWVTLSGFCRTQKSMDLAVFRVVLAVVFTGF